MSVFHFLCTKIGHFMPNLSTPKLGNFSSKKLKAAFPLIFWSLLFTLTILFGLLFTLTILFTLLFNLTFLFTSTKRCKSSVFFKFNYLLGSSILNNQSSDIYSSEIFQEHFLALFQAIVFFLLG